LLLEVVVALTIMTAAMGILGAQLVNGLQMEAYADVQTRTAELADRTMALLELDLRYAEQLATDAKLDGDFGEQYPGYFWHVHIDPLETPGVGLITMQILYQTDPEKRESAEGATVVRELHFLKAAPQKIDLAADFGFSEEQIMTVTTNVPLPGIANGQLDVPALIQQLTADPATMMQMLPALIQAFAGMMGGAGGGANGGGGVSIDAIRQMMQDNMQAALNGEPPPTGDGEGMPDMTGDGVSDANDLLRLRDQMFGGPRGGAGGPRGLGGGGRGPGRGRGGTPRIGGGDGAPATEDGDGGDAPRGGAGNPPAGGRDPAQALEELMRLRDEFNRKQRDGG
jgi:hypothetical protein